MLENINESGWENIAKIILIEEEKINRDISRHAKVILKWGGENYMAILEEIENPFYKDIVSLSKILRPLNKKIIQAVKKLQPERQEYTADNSIDLTGRYYLLRREGKNLIRLTQEQSLYCLTTKYRHN